MGKAKTLFNLALDTDLCKKADKIAAKFGLSRSRFIAAVLSSVCDGHLDVSYQSEYFYVEPKQ